MRFFFIISHSKTNCNTFLKILFIFSIFSLIYINDFPFHTYKTHCISIIIMKIHFIGVLGASMHALYELTKSFGVMVTGSDKLLNGHDARNVDNADLVVYTNAVNENNCELLQAKRLGIPIIERAAYLAEISKNYSTVVAVSGCHGKSTTTAMLARACRSLSPTAHVGAKNSSVIGECSLFITEACEYRRSFLTLSPDLAIVLNVEYDHPDFYKSEYDLFRAYSKLCEQSKLLLVNGDDPLCKKLKKRFSDKCFTFGFNARSDYRAERISTHDGKREFIFCHGSSRTQATISAIGEHNAYDALAALAGADMLGVDAVTAINELNGFTGIPRRFEYKGKAYGKDVYIDYAHHPTEIKATITTAKELYDSVAVVFQPHTYSRTVAFIHDFCSSLSTADTIILLPTFAARERSDKDPVIELKRKLDKQNAVTYLLDDFNQAVETCKLLDEKAIIFMGAGNVDECCKRFILSNEKNKASVFNSP